MPQKLKIALVYKEDKLLDRSKLAAFEAMMKETGTEYQTFRGFVQLAESGYVPDCVLVINVQEAKLVPYPTYGVINFSLPWLFSRKRLIRNLLTYDGCVTLSPFASRVLKGLYFAATKFGAGVGTFGLSPPAQPAPDIDFKQAKLCYILTPFDEPGIVYNLFRVLDRKEQSALSCLDDHTPSYYHRLLIHKQVRYDDREIKQAYAAAGIGLDLNSCNDVNRNIGTRLQYILASGALAITNHSDYLEEMFGDTLLYLSPRDNAASCIEKIEYYVDWARRHPDEAAYKAKAAQEVYARHFDPHHLMARLQEFHLKTLQSQGYLPPSPEEAKTLPTVSYIMRTGGDPKYIRSVFDSLSAQSYPHIQVILVLYKPLPMLEEILAAYQPRLKFKVVEDFGQLRSTGIVTGMRNVDTEYFGLLDDDDPLHSNHIRSLINTLRHHNKRDWRGEIRLAYSGNYNASDTIKFPEKEEWYDEYLEPFGRRRAVENFAFYETDKMSSHQWFMMSNAWLAHRSLIDDELLEDPQTHSHEDIYFELQFALRTHFAFSVEMTSVHWFHGNNSTLVDVDRNEIDVFHHMLRLHYRSFPRAKLYRTYLHALHEGITPITIPAGEMPVYLHHYTDIPKRKLLYLITLMQAFMRYARTKGLKDAMRRTLWWVYKHM